MAVERRADLARQAGSSASASLCWRLDVDGGVESQMPVCIQQWHVLTIQCVRSVSLLYHVAMRHDAGLEKADLQQRQQTALQAAICCKNQPFSARRMCGSSSLQHCKWLLGQARAATNAINSGRYCSEAHETASSRTERNHSLSLLAGGPVRPACKILCPNCERYQAT